MLGLIACNDSEKAKGQEQTSRLSDSLALVDLFNSTDGNNWNHKDGWLTNKPLEEWHGIKMLNGRVTEIRLLANRLTGKIPESIGNLSNLELLCLCDNQLTGEIPESMGELSKLKTFHLNNNRLSGEIPDKLLSKFKGKKDSFCPQKGTKFDNFDCK